MSTLRQNTFRAFSWDFGASILKGILGFTITVFLARLVAPHDFGVVAIALAIIGFSEIFIEGGFSKAIIQMDSRSEKIYSSVFIFNLAVGLFLSILCFLFGNIIQSVFEVHGLGWVIKAMSPVFVLNSINVVQITLLHKSLNFKTLVSLEIISLVFSGGVAVLLALNGMGLYSLVTQHLLYATIFSITIWYKSSWYPKSYFSMDSLRSLAGFSSYVFLSNVLANVFKRLDVLIIGKLFDPSFLGNYSKAQSLKNQIGMYSSSSFQKVFFPVLASVKSEEKRFALIFEKAIAIISFISFLLAGSLFAISEPLILGLYGQNWTDAVWVFQIVVLSAVNMPFNSMFVNALNSKGLSKHNFWIGLFRKAVRLVSFVILIWFGVKWFLWSVVIISFGLTLFNFILVGRILSLNLKNSLKNISISLMPFLSLVLLVYFEVYLPINDLVLGTMYVLIYLLFNFIFKSQGLGELRLAAKSYLK
jgi:O-antigen/teichoic acid export membrane protein